jgi:hypothetical protein
VERTDGDFGGHWQVISYQFSVLSAAGEAVTSVSGEWREESEKVEE